MVYKYFISDSSAYHFSLATSLEQLTLKYQDDQLARWSSVSDPITQWINTHDKKLQSLQGAAEDITSIQEQQKEAEVRILFRFLYFLCST